MRDVATSTPDERVRRGRYLQAARERAGVSQDDVADLLGYAKGAIVGHWEQGRRDPSLANLKRMAAIYGVPLALFTEPPASELDVIEDAILREERRAVVRGLDEEAEAEERQHQEARTWAQRAEPPTLRRVNHPEGEPGRW